MSSEELNTPTTRVKDETTSKPKSIAPLTPVSSSWVDDSPTNEQDTEEKKHEDSVDLYFLQTQSGENNATTIPSWMDIQLQLSKLTVNPDEDIYFVRNILTAIDSPDKKKFTKAPNGNFLALLRTSFGNTLCDYGKHDFYYEEQNTKVSSNIISCSPYRSEDSHKASLAKQQDPYSLYLSSQPALSVSTKHVQALLMKRLHQFRHLFKHKPGQENEDTQTVKIHEKSNATMVFINFEKDVFENPAPTIAKVRQLLFDSSWENKSDEAKCARMTCNFGKLGESPNSRYSHSNESGIYYSGSTASTRAPIIPNGINTTQARTTNARSYYNQVIGSEKKAIVAAPPPKPSSHTVSVQKPIVVSAVQQPTVSVGTSEQPTQQPTMQQPVSHPMSLQNSQEYSTLPSEIKLTGQINGQLYAVTLTFTQMQPVHQQGTNYPLQHPQHHNYVGMNHPVMTHANPMNGYSSMDGHGYPYQPYWGDSSSFMYSPVVNPASTSVVAQPTNSQTGIAHPGMNPAANPYLRILPTGSGPITSDGVAASV